MEGFGKESLFWLLSKAATLYRTALWFWMEVRTSGEILDSKVRVFVLGGHSTQTNFFSYILLEIWLVPL